MAPKLAGLRLFISYPRGGASHSWAERVHADLEARGATVWRDERNIDEGDADWYARIRDALERADAVVGVFGTESAACRWQQREMLRADRLTLPVLAFAIGATPLPMYVIEKQPVTLRDPRNPAPSFDALAAAISRQVSAAVSPGAALPNALTPDAAQRRCEQAWLAEQVNNALADHEALYEPLAARQQAAPAPARLR